MNKREKHETTGHPEKKVKRVKTHHLKSNTASVIIDPYEVEAGEICEDALGKVRETSKTLQGQLGVILNDDSDSDEMVLQICVLMTRLKKLNRLDKHKWKKSRDVVNEKKQKLEALNLQYQNLLYEFTHLQKEVSKCLAFRSRDEEIELVPVVEFYAEAPASISKPEITKNDSHELYMARLKWELEQRERLAIEMKDAEKMREEYIDRIKEMKENLESVHPIMQSIVEATIPLQNKFCHPLHSKLAKHKVASYLPDPLYVLYALAHAYQVSSKIKFEISAEGNTEDANISHMEVDTISEDSGESDQEESADVLHRHSVSSAKEKKDEDILKKHPMVVVLTISEGDHKLTLEFAYLFHLDIVTVTVKSITPQPLTLELVGDLMKTSTFLDCLFLHDTGMKSPNMSNSFKLKSAGYDKSPFSNDNTGLPFLWAQKLAGLEFLPEMKPNAPSGMQTRCRFIEATVEAIHKRLASRVELCHQISCLEQRTNIPPKFATLYPLNVISQLKKWQPVDHKAVTPHPKYEEMVELHLVTKNAMLFNAEIQRGSAALSIVVIILPDYPQKTPLFLLQLQWKGCHTSATSNALHELEEEVNVHFVQTLAEEFKSSILICQMYHLCVCFDVFLETEGATESFEGPKEFVQEKVVVRSSRGPSHSRPYKCISNQGIFVYR